MKRRGQKMSRYDLEDNFNEDETEGQMADRIAKEENPDLKEEGIDD